MHKKILFIEDEPDQVMMVKTRFENMGFSVTSAVDGEEGLKKIDKEKPDLILVDVVIPKVDGIEVCKRLRHNENSKDIPIILITAAGMEDFEEQCKGVGANACFRRPYEPTELDEKIKTLVKE
jgi:CheY-like chemotaxis protein